MELLTPSGGTLFWTFVTFALLLFILAKVAWRPILKMLDEREKKIRDSLDEAEKARAEAERISEEQKEIIEKSKKEAQNILAKTRKTAESTKDEIIQKANQEAEQILKNAKREIELSRDKAIEQIKDLAVDLSIAATHKLIGKTLDEKEHKKIIDESMKKMGDMN